MSSGCVIELFYFYWGLSVLYMVGDCIAESIYGDGSAESWHYLMALVFAPILLPIYIGYILNKKGQNNE